MKMELFEKVLGEIKASEELKEVYYLPNDDSTIGVEVDLDEQMPTMWIYDVNGGERIGERMNYDVRDQCFYTLVDLEIDGELRATQILYDAHEVLYYFIREARSWANQ